MNDEPERNIFLYQELESTVAESLTRSILMVNDFDDQDPENIRKPINLYISCYGGDVYLERGLSSVIRYSKTPVHTVVAGAAFSAAFVLCLQGVKRLSMRSSRFMYHEVMSEMEGGTFCHMKLATDEMAALNDDYINEVVTKSLITKKKLVGMMKKRPDWYFSAEEALKLGVIDAII